MGEEVKKISFGFSKLVKKTNIVPSKLSQANPEEKKVEFIDCLESNAIKLKDNVKLPERLLVIPMRNQLQGTSSVDQEYKTDNIQSQTRPTISPQDHQINDTVQPLKTDIQGTDPSIEKNKIDQLQSSVNDYTNQQSNSPVNSSLTLDEIAAKEILEDLKRNSKLSDKPNRNLSVPLASNTPDGEKESSLEDYDNIPVTEYGLAMLRGMGWAPGKGIGKNEKLVTPSLPTLRPKGMGLGADKVVKDATINKITNEDLKMEKGSFIRVIVGSYKDSYGQIEGFDDESGRLIIKLALRNMTVSLNEFMVQLVDKVEFAKNSKVINVSKYEQYKDEENKIDSNREKSKNNPKLGKGKYDEDSSNETYKSNSKHSRSDILNKQNITSSESELSDSRTASVKVERLMTSRKSRDRAYKFKHGSSFNSSDDNNHRKTRSPVSKSLSKGSKSGFNSNREASVKGHKKKSSHRSRSVSRGRSKSWHSSSSSYSTSSSSDYKRRRKHNKKKPSSRKPKSRSRSRTPKKHGKSKKHKKRKHE